MQEHIRWYHYAGGAVVTVVVNAAGLYGMGSTYRWYYADEEEKLNAWKEKYGLPSEKQRLDVFRWLAPRWDETYGMVERSGAAVYRKEIMQRARGEILEVCMGTGTTLEALPKAGEVTSYTGVDIIEGMLAVARPKLSSVDYPARVVCADAQSLPFPDRSFDTVMGSLALCSLERPDEALCEMARVCRADGQVLLMECGVAEHPLIRFGQRYLGLVPNPKHAWEVGWYDDRDPPALLAACPQLVVTSQATRVMGNWYLIAAQPRGEE